MEASAYTTTIFSNGSFTQLHPGFVSSMARSHRFQIFVIFCISFFVFTRPYESQIHLDRWLEISIIVTMSGMVFAVYLAAFAFLIRFGRHLRIRRFHTIWLVLLTSALTSLLGQKSLAFFGQPQLSTSYILMLWGFHFAIFTGLEVLFGIFVLPDLRPHRDPGGDGDGDGDGDDERHLPKTGTASTTPIPLRPEPAAPVATAPTSRQVAKRDDTPHIVISDRRFSAPVIRSVISQEHYISVSLFGGDTQFLRGRIRDFLGQVPEDLGYCIHRSHWVSWAGIARVDNLKDSTIVILDDSSALPVARGRRSDFNERWNRRVQHG